MNALGRAMGAMERVLEALACVLLLALLVLTNVEVVARYGFGTSTLIADEYGGYAMVWMTMLGAVHLLRAERHLSMTAVVDRLGPFGRRAAGFAAALIGLSICAVLLYSTASLVLASAKFGTVSIQPSRTPLAWPQAILPLGYAVLCAAYLEELIRRAAGLAPRRSDTISENIS